MYHNCQCIVWIWVMSSELVPILMHFKVPISFSWDYKAGEEVLFRRRRKTIPIYYLLACLVLSSRGPHNEPEERFEIQQEKRGKSIKTSLKIFKHYKLKPSFWPIVPFMSVFWFVSTMYFVYVVFWTKEKIILPAGRNFITKHKSFQTCRQSKYQVLLQVILNENNW